MKDESQNPRLSASIGSSSSSPAPDTLNLFVFFAS
jgi:hypothetical protein